MGFLLEKLLGWLRVLPTPSPDGPVGVADPELDRTAPAPPGRRAPWRFGRWEADYWAWKKLALQLASGLAPEGVSVGHSLSLAKLRIRSLPAGLTVQGDLDLRQCQRLRTIGDGLVVAGDLLIGGRSPRPSWWEESWLREAERAHVPALALHILSRDNRCPLSALPSGLLVGGDLRLHNAWRLERLPDDLRVGRSIELAGCTSLAALPDPFVVTGDLTIIAARGLAALPERLSVGGTLRLVGAQIRELPDRLAVGGDLVLECCPRLSAVPEGLAVGGSLVVRRCPIARLPEGLRVGRDLRLHRLHDLEETPVGLSAPGRIEVVDCRKLRRVAPGLRAGTDLRLRRCQTLRELPEGLVVPGTLDLGRCEALEHLPGGMEVGSAPGRPTFAPALRLDDCRGLKALPEDLSVDGPIEVAGSGLREIPEHLGRSVRLLWRGVVVPPEVVLRPETLTPERILGERNAELRRVILERVGLDEVLWRAGALVEDSDRDPGGDRRLLRVRLRRSRLPSPFPAAEDRLYLHCRCPSTGREYLLRVPPGTQTCREAAAWLAGFDDPEQYRPVRET